MSETWTIGELAERAADELRAHSQPVNGRVRDVPGERLIRWYTTIGLVDPPLTRRGRIAQYGRRHLLQLVAIKRLQAAGRSIAEIQAALTGATDAMLQEIAAPEEAILPPPRPAATAADEEAAPAAEGRARFWAAHEGAALRAARRTQEGGEGQARRTQGSGEARRTGKPLVWGVKVADGVTVTVDGGGRLPSEEDVQAVLAAAGPLLAVLEERKLA
ncbi:MerR family transcriptional regulator [Nonomuraea sediminis]|uniref:MerR family transcriptional regulator n=1 Tax=Nonomuraea sediminis TaxID=2835864 RepID=UPI001BDD40E7|nr:MerR family transcriptional regulator [Nonomuraea sediminis]